MDLKKILLTAAIASAVGAGPASAAQEGHDRARPRNENGQTRNNPQRGSEARGGERRGERRAEPAPPPPAARAVPRTEAQPRGERESSGERRHYDPRSYEPRYYGGRSYYVPRYYVAPRIWVPRPYRPGLTYSFGIFFGNPYPYRWAYPVPVPVPYGYSPYPTFAPGYGYGGIAFAVSPADAAVFVDGNYVGIAETFDGRREPLTLGAGRHRIQLQAAGYEAIAFDVDVIPGQVIPYQGGLQPGYSYPY